MFEYGAQYYRYPNPDKAFWEDDFATMKAMGFTVVKLWASWNIIGYKENEYDYSDLDTLIAIAKKNDIKIILNTIIENAPYWLVEKYPEAVFVSALGYKALPHSRGNTPAGGWPGLCTHHPEVRKSAEDFFTSIATHYKDNDTIYAFDIWNEIFLEANDYYNSKIETGLYCHCHHTKQEFKRYLKKKYGSLEELNNAWFRKYSAWEEVYPPIERGGYPDMLDWLTFRLEDRTAHMHWRYNTFRNADNNVRLISHYACLDKPKHAADLTSVADIVDEWGVSTFAGYNRSGDVTEEFLYRLDIARSDAKGKKFWQSELKGGQNTGGNGHCALRRSPMAKQETMACWNWCVLMAGAKGLMYWQFRPEYLGPETPGNGLTDLMGNPTDRSENAHFFAKLTTDNEFIGASQPTKSKIAILRLNEADLFGYLLDSSRNWYEDALAGAYNAFAANNYQVDIITANDISNYKLVYIPFAQMINDDNIKKIRQYVRAGGRIVAEAATAHYKDGGFCSYQIPGDMTDLFGAQSTGIEYYRIDEEKPMLHFDNQSSIAVAVYQEKYELLGGTAIAKYNDNSIAAVQNSFGQGASILVGTYISLSATNTASSEVADIFDSYVKWAGIESDVKTNDINLKARVHTYNNEYYLYIVNLKNTEIDATLSINTVFGNFTSAISTVNKTSCGIKNNSLHINVAGCGGDIFKLSL